MSEPTPKQKQQLRAAWKAEGKNGAEIKQLMQGPAEAIAAAYATAVTDGKIIESTLARATADNQAAPPKVRKGRGPGKNPVKSVTTVQLGPDLIEGLQAIAIEEERTVSALIRLAIRRYLQQKARNKKTAEPD